MSGTTRKSSGRVPRMLGSQHAPWAAAALAAVLMSASPLAQTPPAAPATTAAAPAATVGQDGPLAESDDITALVAPIALYPDPLLSVILQASTLPIQIVQAQRFLDKRASDPKAAPDPEWDRSIMALLNYPSLVQAMSEYIDWTEELGNAVLDRLEDVQEEIQQIRWSAHTTGILVSNSAQKVVVEGNVIAINPVKDAVIQIPKYDPAALLAAIEPATATVDIESAVPVTAAAPVTTEAPATAEAPAAVAPATTAAAPVEAAPATAPAPAYAPAPAPVYEQAPVYAAAPAAPVVAYSEPQSSFWSSAAPFLGGAAIGGLLGYALADDDDDDDDDGYNGCREDCYYGGGGGNWDSDDWDSDNWNGNGGNNKQNKQYQNNKQNNINVEGNNVVVVDNDKLKKDLNANRNRVQGDRGGAGTGGRTQGRQEVSALPASRSGQADRTQANRGQGASATPASRAAAPAKRDVRLPSPGGKPPGAQATAQPQRVQSAEQRQRTQSKSPGQAKPQTSAALGNGQDSKRAAEAQASRGAQSRAAAPAAPTRQPAAAPRPQQQQAQAPQRQQQRAQGPQAQKSGGGMRVDSGQRAQRDSARGQQSRGDGGGGRGGGGGGRGGGGGGGGGRRG